jgi:hypothetical protein
LRSGKNRQQEWKQGDKEVRKERTDAERVSHSVLYRKAQ